MPFVGVLACPRVAKLACFRPSVRREGPSKTKRRGKGWETGKGRRGTPPFPPTHTSPLAFSLLTSPLPTRSERLEQDLAKRGFFLFLPPGDAKVVQLSAVPYAHVKNRGFTQGKDEIKGLWQLTSVQTLAETLVSSLQLSCNLRIWDELYKT